MNRIEFLVDVVVPFTAIGAMAVAATAHYPVDAGRDLIHSANAYFNRIDAQPPQIPDHTIDNPGASAPENAPSTTDLQ